MTYPGGEAVAEVYSDACEAGEPPTEAVMLRFGCPRSTAGRWVARARATGHLAPTVKGKSPRLSKRRKAAAADLGVTLDVLEAVLRKHGALRI